MSQINLYYAAPQLGVSGFGWATCNEQLIKALSKLCQVWTKDNLLADETVHGPVFQPIADHDLNPCTPIRGTHNFGYCFFESDLGPNAAANAAKYDVVFCGSTWCLERMKERGITNGRVLIQGVDHDVFKPLPVTRNDNEFRIFSGGKFEYRKGQDIVIAAFRELVKKYDNMRLVCAWHNPWPGLILGMQNSPHLTWVDPEGMDQIGFYHALTKANGIDPSKVSIMGQLTQGALAEVMNQTDLGVFPNRCEGGTNLVLMEYMACGKPIVASFDTGHTDVWDYGQCCPVFGSRTEQGWCDCSPDDAAAKIEKVMEGGWRTPDGEIKQWTWERAARTIVDTVLEYENA